MSDDHGHFLTTLGVILSLLMLTATFWWNSPRESTERIERLIDEYCHGQPYAPDQIEQCLEYLKEGSRD